MSRSRFDRNDPVDRKMVSDHDAQRRRTATSAGGYKSGPQFSQAGSAPPASATTPKPTKYDGDRYIRMSDEKALAEYKKVQAELKTAEGDPAKALKLMDRQMHLMFLLIDRRLTPE